MAEAASLSDLTLAQCSALLQRRALSPVELAEAALARIARLDATLHAFITVTADIARGQARAAEARAINGTRRGPLDGIPLALKDNIDTAGVRTTSHSRLLMDNVPAQDAVVAARLADAGGVLLGKTALFEFAHGGPSWDLPWPPALNPWSLRHLPGGSSSGAAAAVAAGLVLGAVGTDTGGSVRWPAAVCGITGFKPTYGRVSRRGVHPNSFSQDHCGVMARTVEDCALLLQAMAGHDPLDVASLAEPVPDYCAGLGHGIAGLRVGVVRHWYAQDGDAAVVACVDAALHTLTALGAVVEEVQLAPLQDYNDCKTLISVSELYAAHGEALRTRPQDFGQLMRARIVGGALTRADDYLQALRWRGELARGLFRPFQRFDVLVTAGWLGTAEPNDPQAADSYQRPMVTIPFSLCGNPALCVPCGFSPEGLPVSLQIAGPPMDEADVLRAGHAYQLATDWHTRRPAMEWAP